LVRQRVQDGLRLSHPFVTVSFWDHHAEMEVEVPPDDGNYSLMIHQDAPIYSACMH
jgi:hypothetical protein